MILNKKDRREKERNNKIDFLAKALNEFFGVTINQNPFLLLHYIHTHEKERKGSKTARMKRNAEKVQYNTSFRNGYEKNKQKLNRWRVQNKVNLKV